MAETASQVLTALREVAREDKAEFLPGFFQAVPGGYGEGDRFLGCVVPDQRKIARQFRGLSIGQVQKLLNSPWHECRLTGWFILVLQFERAMKGRHADRKAARELLDFYLGNLHAANNWDLVDSTAPKILGPWLLENPKDRSILNRLSRSKVLWERRVAVVATYALIRADEFDEILVLSKRLLKDKHDLMHKAVGWMLREAWKRNPELIHRFLQQHVSEMPRTMLRYTIEKMTPQERQAWLAK